MCAFQLQKVYSKWTIRKMSNLLQNIKNKTFFNQQNILNSKTSSRNIGNLKAGEKMKKLRRNMLRLINLEVMKNSQVMVTMKKQNRIMITSYQNKNISLWNTQLTESYKYIRTHLIPLNSTMAKQY
jgi:hypothetical protein